MEPIRIYKYYSFGFNYHILLRGNEYKTNKECHNAIVHYRDLVDSLDLRVTKSSMRLKIGLHDNFRKLASLAQNKKTQNEKIEPKLWKSIIDDLEKVDGTLDAELNIKTAYLLDEKRYANEILISKIENLFSENTYFNLPSIAQIDFSESGKCLAFDRYTACAFHSLRGTEDVLKMYYEKILKRPVKVTDTWGTFETAILTAISTKTLMPPPEEQLMINITSLRKYYRNKTQHPDITYNKDEAQDLLSHCIKSVNDLISDLRERGLI